MPRKPRFFVPDIPNHVIQRGNNREAVFFEDEDYQTYKNILHESAESSGVKIHAYVLMTNHIHILATANSSNGISLMMQKTGRFYVPYINHKYTRTGTLWEGRFKSALVDSDFYVLACMRYIEMNPVRAHMVDAPQDYKWSSYGYNAFDQLDRLVTSHASYLGLSRVEKQRRSKYIDLFSEHLDEKVLRAIRNCAQTGTPLGSSQFIQQIEDKLKVNVGYSRRGRPWINK